MIIYGLIIIWKKNDVVKKKKYVKKGCKTNFIFITHNYSLLFIIKKEDKLFLLLINAILPFIWSLEEQNDLMADFKY